MNIAEQGIKEHAKRIFGFPQGVPAGPWTLIPRPLNISNWQFKQKIIKTMDIFFTGSGSVFTVIEQMKNPQYFS